jgi:hypothetical protein
MRPAVSKAFQIAVNAFRLAVGPANFRFMTTGKAGSRAQALRRARELKSARDQRRFERERQIEVALAEFIRHNEIAELVRAQAQDRVSRLLAIAEERAVEHEGLAEEAIRTMANLGEVAADIAELTGLPRARVREIAKST